MRLYAKLALFVALFVCLRWLSGASGPEPVWDVSLGVRAYVASLLGDKRLHCQLVAEAQVHMHGTWMQVLARQRSTTAQQLCPGDFD
jgi:hypothetical protein